MFFIYKKGERLDPDNFRSTNVQNAILKIFTSILSTRLLNCAERQFLLPAFHFGYHRKVGTVHAKTLLKEVFNKRLNPSKGKCLRTYLSSVDFKKCFHSINRQNLYVKLQEQGIPYIICRILDSIYSNNKCYIRSGYQLA